MASKITINLDTSKENYLICKCKQNDDLTLEAFIFENGEALNLTNKEITIQGLKADNTYIIQNTNIIKENNKIIAELEKDFTRVAGKTLIEIVLVESGKQNTTFSFYLEVVNSVIKGAVESSNTVTILEALENKIVEAGAVKAETEQLITSGNAATKGDIQAVNASLEQNTNKMDYKTRSGKNKLPKLITFLTDDGRGGERDLAKIFIKNNYPLCGCIITDSADIGGKYHLSWSDINNYINNHGFEYGAHTVNVGMAGSKGTNLLDGYTYEEMEYQISESKKRIEEKTGKPCDYFVYPEGQDNVDVRNLSRKYFKASIDTLGGINKPPVLMHPLGRHAFLGYDDGVTKVNELVNSSEGWLIFMYHTSAGEGDMDYTIIDNFLQYVKTTGIPMVTISEGLKHYENKIDVGDFVKDTWADGTWESEDEHKYFISGADGTIWSDKLEHYSRKKSHTQAIKNTKPSDYPPNTTTHEYANTLQATTEGFPSGAGHLVTVTFDKVEYNYSLYYPISEPGKIYRRVYKTGDVWTEFELVGREIPIIHSNTITSATTPTELKKEKTYIRDFNGAEATEGGFGSLGAGILYTHIPGDLANRDGWAYQEYVKHQGNKKYKRYWTGVWSTWKLIETEFNTTRGISVEHGTIPANSTVDFSLTASNLTTSFGVIKCTSTLPNGIGFSLMTHRTDNPILRIINTTSIEISLGTKVWDYLTLDI